MKLNEIIVDLLAGQTLPRMMYGKAATNGHIQGAKVLKNFISQNPGDCGMTKVLTYWLSPRDLLFLSLALSVHCNIDNGRKFIKSDGHREPMTDVFVNQIIKYWGWFQVDLLRLDGVGMLHGELQYNYNRQSQSWQFEYKEIFTFDNNYGFANVQINNLLVMGCEMENKFCYYVTDLNLSNTNMLSDESFAVLISQPMFCENVKKLNISYCFELTLHSIKSIVLKFIKLECVVFQLNRCAPKHLRKYAQFFLWLCDLFEKITYLDFAGCRMSGTPASMEVRQQNDWLAPPFWEYDTTHTHRFIMSLYNLSHLIPKLDIKCDTLLPCTMRFNVYASERLAVNLIGAMHSLTELHIGNSFGDMTLFDDKCIDGIVVKCSKLVRVSFQNCNKLTDDGIMTLVYSSGSLRKISITDCVRLTQCLKHKIQHESQQRMHPIDTREVYADHDRVFQLNF